MRSFSKVVMTAKITTTAMNPAKTRDTQLFFSYADEGEDCDKSAEDNNQECGSYFLSAMCASFLCCLFPGEKASYQRK